MLRQQAKFLNRLSVAFDGVVIAIAFMAAYFLRKPLPGGLGPIHGYVWVLFLVVPIWFFLLSKNRLYASIRRLSTFDIITRLVNVHILGGVAVAAIIYFVDRDQYSRGLFIAFVGFSWLLLTLEKVALRTVLGVLRKRGYNIRNLLIVGTREKAQRFHELLEQHADWGLKVIGFVQAVDGALPENIYGYPVLGRVDSLIELCKQEAVDEVVFCIPNPREVNFDVEHYLRDLEELGVTVRMALDFYQVSCWGRELNFFHNEIPLLTFYPKAFDSQQLFFKRALDVLGGLVGTVVTLVLFPLVAFAIKWEDPGPVLFSQERVGENGRIFKIWKFRSMFIDAEERKKELMAQNEMKGAMFKMKDDPRVTRVGNFLRKTSLDEFPQFWNVLKGEMSLVGTRPPTSAEVAEYENWHRRRISIKPGITGMWQVSGRSKIDDFNEIVRLDLQYIDNWSIWLDIRILFKTLWVVMARRGSC